MGFHVVYFFFLIIAALAICTRTLTLLNLFLPIHHELLDFDTLAVHLLLRFLHCILNLAFPLELVYWLDNHHNHVYENADD